MKTVKTYQKEITPKEASNIIEKAEKDPLYKNRPLSESTVASYASDMKNGLWTPNPQPIVFDENGTLKDGQHRLWGIIFSNTPIILTISEGWPSSWDTKAGQVNLIDNIDRGRVRNVGQQLTLSHGIEFGKQTASCIRQIGLIYGLGNEKLTTAGHLLILQYYKTNISSIFEKTSRSNQRVAYLTAPLSLLFSFEPSYAINFAHNFFKLENLNDGSAELAVLRYIERNEFLARGPEGGRMQLYKAIITALYLGCKGEKIGTKFSIRDKAMDWLIDNQQKDVTNAINKFLLELKKTVKTIRS